MPRLKAQTSRPPAVALPRKPPLKDRWAILIILLATLPWWIAATCKFIAIDDDDYVTMNPEVLGGLHGHSIVWAFESLHAHFWFPLTWLSLMLDASVFGTGPVGFHVTNLVLHIANTILVYFFLRTATRAPGRSLVAALLFSMHPLRVESVAWVTERKDVLFAFFGLWALLAYVWYARGGGWKAYMLMLLSYACSLMSKSMLVTMPALLFLVDVWPLERFRATPWRKLILEKIPVAALALAMALLTFLTQPFSLIRSAGYSPGLRLENIALSYAEYLRDSVYFELLSVYYPFPKSIPEVYVALSLTLLVGVTLAAGVAAYRRPAAKPFLIGWLWFVIALLPVIGLLQSGTQARADRFTYFPAIGLTAGIVFLWPAAWNRGRAAAIGKFAAGGLVLTLTVYMVTQLLLWRDPLVLYLDGIDHAGESGMLEFSKGLQLEREHHLDEALDCYRRAMKYDPFYMPPHNNAARILIAKGDLQEALFQLKLAFDLSPDDPAVTHNLKWVTDKLNQAATLPSETGVGTHSSTVHE